MRAVWSFWSEPFRAHYAPVWGTPRNHALAWVGSVQSAARHYPDTMLVTDSAGARLLVDRLGLEFSEVSTCLDRFQGRDPGWWVLGKLAAYGMQTAPFVHIDNDVFLWKPLPARLESASVLLQHPEVYSPDQTIYRTGDVERAFAETGGVLPVEWRWARARPDGLTADNCGIVGGCDVAFMRYFAETALDLVDRPENAAGWSRYPDKWHFVYIVEQFLLSACVGYHQFHPDSAFKGVQAQYLFRSWDEARDPRKAEQLGFTHLMAWSKRAPAIMHRLSERVRKEWPEFFWRCERRSDWMPGS
jgi:hypothetical protein